MKFTAEAAPLAAVLARAAEVAGDGKVIPILGHVLLRAEAGTLTLTASDLDSALTETVPVEVAAKGTATAPAKMLADITRRLPAGSQIGFRLDEPVLHVTGGRSRFRLSTLPVTDFPAWMDGELPHRFSIAAPDLRRLIAKTQFAISDEETRYYLCGIHLHVAAGKLRAVATDGFLLARYDAIDLPAGLEFPGIIVPGETVATLHRLLAKRDSGVMVDLSQTRIKFSFDAMVLVSKLIDGTFPDYARVIPENKKELRIATADLGAAIERVALMASPVKPGVKIEMNGSGIVTLLTRERGDDPGFAAEELEARYQGDALAVGFNPRYAREIIAQIDSAETSLFFGPPGTPILLVDGSALFVLMPLHI